MNNTELSEDEMDEFVWINTMPGVLVLSGTQFSIRLSTKDEFNMYRSSYIIGTMTRLSEAKEECERKLCELKELGLL